MTDAPWSDVLAFALTGEWLGLLPGAGPEVDALIGQLGAAGWAPDTIADHARAVQEAGRPWPHPVPTDRRSSLGAAQFHAALARLREQLGVDGLVTQAPSGRTALNADERRLLAEAPPHAVQR